MARRPTIGGNWKLHLAPAEARAVAEALVPLVADRGDVHVVIYPTAISLTAVVEAVAGSGIEVGIQDVHTAPTGAYTGANSAALARAAGATRALVGHSERRAVFGDDDATVNAKLKACLAAGLLPTLCIGETLDERDAGRIEAVLFRQLAGGLEGLTDDQVAACVIAYEPVWAIGTGRTATPQQAQEAHASIRRWLRDHFPAYVADGMRIQYGGSVKPSNAAELMACEDIDGALVGGASLDSTSFAGIVSASGR
jgi:triosephosphate isomerase